MSLREECRKLIDQYGNDQKAIARAMGTFDKKSRYELDSPFGGSYCNVCEMRLRAPSAKWPFGVWKHAAYSRQHLYNVYRQAGTFHPDDNIRFVISVVIDNRPFNTHLAWSNSKKDAVAQAEGIIEKGEYEHVELSVWDRKAEREVTRVSRRIMAMRKVLEKSEIPVPAVRKEREDEKIEELVEKVVGP